MVCTSDKIIANSTAMVAGCPGPLRVRRGFTLIEMVVVISIICLLAVTALPSIFTLFSSGTDSQAYNLLSSTLTAARTEAIQSSTYTLVHVQFGDAAVNDDNKEKCWIVVFMYDKAAGKFKRIANFTPQAMPGTMAFGRVDSPYVSGSAFSTNFAGGLTSTFDQGFRRFSIIFSPTGSVVATVNGANPVFDTTESIWAGSGGQANARLWNVPPNEAGVTAVTLFDYRMYSAILPLPDKAPTSATNNKKIYLDDNGQLIGLNVYTGQLLPRK